MRFALPTQLSFASRRYWAGLDAASTMRRHQRVALYALALIAAGAFFVGTTSLIGWFLPAPTTVGVTAAQGR